MHSLWSDGTMLPERVVAWYKNHGYQFVGLSDHNVVPLEERWIPAAKVFENLPPGIHGNGEAPVFVSRIHDASEELKLKTLPELKREFDASGRFLLLCDEEVTSTGADHPVHVTAVNVGHAVPSVNEATASGAIQRMLEGIVRQAHAQRYPALGFINHPNFTWALGASDLASVREARFVEVFNGHPFTASRGDLSRRGVLRMWDMANAERVLERDWPPLYGVASDDAHVENGAREASLGRGWIVVRVSALRATDLLLAMQKGDFYASTGVRLKHVYYDRERRFLSVSVDPEPGETYLTEFIVTKTVARPSNESPNDRWDVPMVGVVAASTSTLESRYFLTKEDAFARAVVTSSKAPDNRIDSDYTGDAVQFKQAFTQPVGWENRE